MHKTLRWVVASVVVAGLLLGAVGLALLTTAAHAQGAPAPQAESTPTPDPNNTADHTQFEILHQDFQNATEVTKACLTCHTEAAKQVMQTTHWTWEFKQPETGQLLGKKHVVNNFCIAVTSNWPRCTSCHAGYGWKDANFDFGAEENVDCLVCHDTTGKYKKFPAGAGHPVYEEKEFPPGSGKIWKPLDLSYIAQHVGRPTRNNCGACHFYGGGGDGVKHGDLDSSLKNPPFEVDVHMSPEGANLQCVDCHTPTAHNIPGSRYAGNAKDVHGKDLPEDDHNRASCESCHGLAPHDNAKLNDHVDKVACETCHIPEFARGGVPTKTWWDWSQAGDKNRKGEEEYGRETYHFMKGEFHWGENVPPEYAWYNGTMVYTLATDKIDPSQVVKINHPEGSYDDPNARIWPFKVMRGKQPYDAGNNTLVIPHLFPLSKDDDSAYWKVFDWQKAITAGMEMAGLPYSGKYDFVETEMYWPLAHMVAPADQALKCESCHAPDGRLANLKGFYMPGRDHVKWVDTLGWLLVGLTFLGVLGHAAVRAFTAAQRKK